MKVMGGAALAGGAIVGAAAGSVVLGVAGAGAAAYAVTRNDKVGDAAKATGKATVHGIDKAREINEQHKITATAGQWLQQGVNSARDFNHKHDVTGKMASGVESGMNKLSGWLQPAQAPSKPTAAGSELPPGWQAVATPDGRVYYWNQATGDTTWEKPTAGSSKA